jgi:hypothetical protein
MNSSRTRARAPARLVLALALVLLLSPAARGEEDTYSSSADPEASGGFPWIAFVLSVAALGGLGYWVRRRQRELALQDPTGRGRPLGWYCRECDRDVVGAKCPRCRAESPFLDDGMEAAPGRIRPSARQRAAR